MALYSHCCDAPVLGEISVDADYEDGRYVDCSTGMCSDCKEYSTFYDDDIDEDETDRDDFFYLWKQEEVDGSVDLPNLTREPK